MHTHINPSVVQQLKISSRIFSVLILFFGILVFIDYQWNIIFLKSIETNAVSMNPLTATTFILCGISLLLLHYHPDRFLWIIRILANIILFTGLLKIGSYLFGFNFHLDTLLFSEKSNQPYNPINNQIASNTALCFVLSGIALLLVSFKKEITGQVFSLLLFLFSLFPIIGYGYKVPEFYDVSAFIPMALNTAYCFCLFGLAVLFLHPDKGIMILISNNTVGGLMARILLPLTIIVALLMGYYRLKLQHLGWFDTELGTAFRVIINIIFYVGIILGLTYYLFKKEIKIKKTDDLIVANKELLQVQQDLNKSLKEVSDYKYAINQSSTVEITDSEGKIIFVNENFCKLTQYTTEELIGKDHRIMNSGYHPKFFFAHLWEVILSGETWRGEVRNKAKDGSIFWANTIIVPLWDNSRDQYQYMIFRSDITQRKLAEEAKNLFRTLIDQSNDSIEVIDPETGYFLDGNAKAYSTIGYTRDEFLTLRVFDIDPLVDPSKFELVIEELRKSGSMLWESIHRKKDGSTFSVEVNIRLIRLDREYIVTNVRDTTERKTAFDKLSKAEGEIRNFATHLNKVLETERSNLAREIHDELGQQLASIKIELSVFKKHHHLDKVNEKIVCDLIREVDNTIQSMRKIATQLRPGILDSMGLVPSIRWLVDEFEKHNKVECRLELHSQKDKFDKEISTCFFRICQESLTNISKHAEASKVIIDVHHANNHLTLKISDNGKGFCLENPEKPFSMGLIGMRERANIIGADLKIISKKDFGTTIQLQAQLN